MLLPVFLGSYLVDPKQVRCVYWQQNTMRWNSYEGTPFSVRNNLLTKSSLINSNIVGGLLTPLDFSEVQLECHKSFQNYLFSCLFYYSILFWNLWGNAAFRITVKEMVFRIRKVSSFSINEPPEQPPSWKPSRPRERGWRTPRLLSHKPRETIFIFSCRNPLVSQVAPNHTNPNRFDFRSLKKPEWSKKAEPKSKSYG